ncbi:hypothetical protein WCN79_14685 [Xanthomonas axonopodis pv. vasculorum]|uniref:Uncharacterized protein n=1 Tax=Xanthomonas axonopodis pv. vasculorum TaxID=325777 RepID=A0A098Q1H2_9XANT|nr:hypothetical protein [Xanthomonas axonopodis]KGE52723.1 hypothetical protein GW15_0207235 [Xanthomonas axonopodis pv. vasculorum]PPV05051.1 hypothetical protein XavaCFBP5823_21105 [Xanthomonas axonopodis pv. vasculorum]QKD86445.1 hypothetical protein XAV_08590 [Xanthomonas axonopodis pv. vasculorum]
MDSAFPSPDAHWYRSPKGVRRMLTLLLMSTLLTASLVVLAYRTSFTVLLDLAQYAAALCAVLHVVVVSMLMGLIAGASTVWKTLQTAGKNTQELTQLRQVIVNVMLMLMLAVAAVCIPFVMDIMKGITEVDMVFAIMLIALLIHRVNINRICSRLTDSMTAAQRAAQRTLAA